jgi:hypothetical protein
MGRAADDHYLPMPSALPCVASPPRSSHRTGVPLQSVGYDDVSSERCRPRPHLISPAGYGCPASEPPVSRSNQECVELWG